MDPVSQDRSMDRRLDGFTLNCRLICSVLVVAPLFYWTFIDNGDAYHFLILVLISPLAGLVLVANSLFCLFRYRKIEAYWISLLFTLVGAIGFLVVWHFLPEFRM